MKQLSVITVFFIAGILTAGAALADVILLDGRYPVGGTLNIDQGYVCRQFEFAEPEDTRAAHDWRNVGGEDYMTSIKDQGSCGACWAFGCAAAFEAQVNIENNNTALDWDLSERFEAACYSSIVDDPDCTLGWYAEYALEHMANDFGPFSDGTPGICTETCYPYGDMAAGTNPSSCGDTACPDYLNERVYLDGFAELWPVNNPPGNADDLIKAAISAHGPVIVNMSLKETHPIEPDWQDFSDFWSLGLETDIWTGPIGCSPPSECFGHCVLIVGYDDGAPTPYWIVNNSWGVTHDGSGYFLMEMGYDNSNIWHHPMTVDAPSAVDVPSTSPLGLMMLLISFTGIFTFRKISKSR
jgi:papain like protease